jgi:hypothetical protein
MRTGKAWLLLLSVAFAGCSTPDAEQASVPVPPPGLTLGEYLFLDRDARSALFGDPTVPPDKRAFESVASSSQGELPGTPLSSEEAKQLGIELGAGSGGQTVVVGNTASARSAAPTPGVTPTAVVVPPAAPGQMLVTGHRGHKLRVAVRNTGAARPWGVRIRVDHWKIPTIVTNGNPWYLAYAGGGVATDTWYLSEIQGVYVAAWFPMTNHFRVTVEANDMLGGPLVQCGASQVFTIDPILFFGEGPSGDAGWLTDKFLMTFTCDTGQPPNECTNILDVAQQRCCNRCRTGNAPGYIFWQSLAGSGGSCFCPRHAACLGVRQPSPSTLSENLRCCESCVDRGAAGYDFNKRRFWDVCRCF